MDNQIITQYLQEISRYFLDDNSSEMSYRTPFENLLKEIFPVEKGYRTQHDQRAIAGNKPDFIIFKGDIPILYIEVKKVGEDLDKIEKSSQATRYFGYDNLIISDYVSFRFYRRGIRYDEPIALGTPDIKSKSIVQRSENGERLITTILDFINSHKEPIKSGKHLAKIMGGKALRIRDNTIDFLTSEKADNAELKKIMNVIKEYLVAEIDIPAFADMYAQTLVYGLFAARYHDTTLETFSRQEARELIPSTNPFLQHFFDHIAGVHFPKRLDTIVTELCEVFAHADVKALMQEYFKKTDLWDKTHESPDPVIHFYEDFLHEYNPLKKMEMGVFYTPLPVVRFIIRGVDTILKNEFGIIRGLADDQKMTIGNKEYAKVQILDIATGTGTFLNEVIQHIRAEFAGQEGRWPAYVQESLIHRLHGFELMMASYTIAHLKLGMTLQESGVRNLNGRLGVYLTNTLDDAIETSTQQNLFGFLDSIAAESRAASKIKQEYPIMVVIGNPPYSGESMNPKYTGNDVYKIEPGGKEKLKERNSKWINDDYVKFIRFAESLIEKNTDGVIGMITAHGYIDNPTFRGMRWHLRDTFDQIYVIDLHGNSNKKEISPDGSKDVNVFDIKTGVSIILGVKKHSQDKKKKLATIFTYDVYGGRYAKFETLDNQSLEKIPWQRLPDDCDIWKIEGANKHVYLAGFSVNDLFNVSSVGIVTGRDAIVISEDLNVLRKNIITHANNALFQFNDDRVTKISYRPFDTKYIYYDKAFIERGRLDVMQYFINKENIGLALCRQQKTDGFKHAFVHNNIIESSYVSNKTSEIGSSFPLYLYDGGHKLPNLKKEIWESINTIAGETKPEDILDYVYAYLHSPTYRATYKEFLKTDFPRVPYPTSKEIFWKLVPLGTKLRGLHLLTDSVVHKPITTYPVSGSNMVEKISFSNGKVYINETQYFGNVPEIAWNFYIGGYQPVQKYLKDRKGKVLTDHDITHWQKIIVSLLETDRVMKEIDTVLL